mgnify:CR=1 FL=1
MDLGGFRWISSYWAPVLTGIAYYLAALLGVHYTIMPEGIAIAWPPNAVLLTAFLLSPRKTWWLHALAGVGGEFAADLGSFPVWQITGFALVNVGETLFSALLIGRLTRSHPLNLTVKNLGITIGIILVAIAIALYQVINEVMHMSKDDDEDSENNKTEKNQSK